MEHVLNFPQKKEKTTAWYTIFLKYFKKCIYMHCAHILTLKDLTHNLEFPSWQEKKAEMIKMAMA